MDKRLLQSYSTWAKDNLENQIEVSLKALGINSDQDIRKAKKVGDVTVIDGDPTSYPADLYNIRARIIELVKSDGYKNVIEEFAYTWFNRFVALRFMEVHGFIPHGFYVLSNPAGGIEPQILKNLNLVRDDLKLDMTLCTEYKQQGKIEELFRYVLVKQCNALSEILPMLFSSDMGYLELLLPKSLLKGETVITRLIEIPEAAFLEDVEIIGWMYQFYISSKKDAVYASKKTITKDTLPAVTQLFTPDWIVRYMAENSVGRLWLESYPDSSLRSDMRYYVEDAEQTEEVQKKINEIKYKNVNPEEIRIIEPCCGSGHILVYVFDLLYKMYEERGYQKRDIPTLILKNNLVGLDVDKRAAQLASFSLIMKARSVNNRFFNDNYYETPHVYEIQDSKLLKDMGYRKQLMDLNLLTNEEIDLIAYLVDTFENGKTIGSLLKVNPLEYIVLNAALDKISEQAVPNLFNSEFLNYGIKRLRELADLAKVLSDKYDVMITNPPYIGTSSMEDLVKDYAVRNYPNSKADMFAMFMETGFVKTNGFTAMINMHSWMFLSSYEKLRNHIYDTAMVVCLNHLGARAFEAIGGEVVQTVSFVLRAKHILGYKGTYYRLVNQAAQDLKERAFLLGEEKYYVSTDDFKKIGGEPMAYWASQKTIANFANAEPLINYSRPRVGQNTGDNDRFLRFWFEISIRTIAFGIAHDQLETCQNKWIPYNKGGSFRRWYGNFDRVVNWENNGKEIKDYAVIRNKGKHWSRYIQNIENMCREGISWSDIASTRFGCRYLPQGFICDVKGSSTYPESVYRDYIMAFLNSSVAIYYLQMLNPTTTFQVGNIGSLPFIYDKTHEINALSTENVSISKDDWDSFETSWDFKIHPLIALRSCAGYADNNTEEWCGLISNAYHVWETECHARFDKLKSNEEELNRIFIDIYGLQDELAPVVDDKDVTVRLANKERDIRSLISYLVGVAMGRYSLDVLGLAYAGGNWDDSQYISYKPDDDGIIPIYSNIGMEDGLTTVLIRLIKQIYGEDTYRQNIDFIAEALGKNNNESSEEALNRYLNDGFYADHLKIYQKRPIYWLFTSGKKAGFKCLIYMHRYNEDSLARINGKYYLPESTRKKNELEELNGRIARAEGRDKIKLEKQRQNLAAAYNEAIEYGQILDHMANQYISIDLDDGVKVNYAKFQNVEIVTDSGTKVKKNLLAPLK